MGRIDSPAFRAWYGVVLLNGHTLDRVSALLEDATGMPTSWLEVLAFLHEREDGMRMNELAGELLLSRGGTTRLIARMEEAGYVERIVPPDDRRAVFARITPEGLEAAEKALPMQVKVVEDEIGPHLSKDELETLTRLCAKALDGIGVPCPWLIEGHEQDEAAGAATRQL
ncbi:MarR family winged helix-turn-helix transcriptional regulator [Conexibacter sp. SYSU D00693]|uniref:MarR family winged helix-turn-helix transcriptional regulator n=1 Tax=Conexibacter sp. SYSU D00693 TaxID=2812560 RepID=UPI00196B9E6C|nr:MarR family transcriptional regulator [Conexibacter sp. SYSU D00693]